MKKHGSATKRAFDELMSKSDAGAHRIGKDQTRQGITGYSTAPVTRRRGGNIETLSEKTLSPEQASGISHTAPAHAGMRPAQPTVRAASASMTTPLASASVNQTKIDASNSAKNPTASAPASNPVKRVNPVSQVNQVKQVNPVIRKTAAPHREAKNERPDMQKRVAAPTRSAGISDQQPHRAAVPVTATDGLRR